MNWGGFAGGFSQGFNGGIKMGGTINDLLKEDKIQKVREAGIAEANAARADAVKGMVQDNGAQGQEQAAAQATQAAAPVNTYKVDVPPQQQGIQTPQQAAPTVDMTPAETPAQSNVAPVQPVEPAMPPAAAGLPKRFSVNGRGFDTEADARAHAEKVAPSHMDFMVKTLVPKMQEAYIAQGDMEKAEAWGKYAKEKTTERHMDQWSKMYKAAQAGDMETAADHAFELYKGYDDGVTPVSKEVVKDKDGNVTGFNMKLKNDSTGEVRSQFIDSKAIVEMGLAALSPPAMFEQAYKTKKEADVLRAKAAIDSANDARTAVMQEKKDIRTETRKENSDIRAEKRRAAEMAAQHGYKLEEMATAEQLKEAGLGKAERTKVDTKVQMLKDYGYSQDEVKAVMPHLLGVGDHKKTTDPTERRALVTADLLKNDPKFASEKDPAKQNAKVDQLMGVIYGKETKPAAAPTAPAAGAGGPNAGKKAYLTPQGVIWR